MSQNLNEIAAMALIGEFVSDELELYDNTED